MSLTDAPKKDLKEVNVNIARMEGTGSETAPVEEPVTDGSDTNVDPQAPTDPQFFDENGDVIPPEDLGFDITDPSTYPEGITAADLWMYF